LVELLQILQTFTRIIGAQDNWNYLNTWLSSLLQAF
jgi:hypothetical protein